MTLRPILGHTSLAVTRMYVHLAQAPSHSLWHTTLWRVTRTGCRLCGATTVSTRVLCTFAAKCDGVFQPDRRRPSVSEGSLHFSDSHLVDAIAPQFLDLQGLQSVVHSHVVLKHIVDLKA